jgi:hypothetical protein
MPHSGNIETTARNLFARRFSVKNNWRIAAEASLGGMKCIPGLQRDEEHH